MAGHMDRIIGGVIVASLGWAGAGSAELIHSFENNTLATPTVAAVIGGATGSAFSTTGVTNGSSSLEINVGTSTPGNTALLLVQFDLSQAVLNALQVNPTVTFDISAPNDPNPNDQEFGFGTIWATNQGVGGGFAFGSFFNDFISYGAPPKTVSFTLSQALVDSLDDLGSGDFAQLMLGVNISSGGSATVYIDNVRVVPEPGSVGLFAAGAGLALLRRRK